MELKQGVNELHNPRTTQSERGWIHDDTSRALKDDFFFDKVIGLKRRACRDQIDDDI
jgi:hypothetical protein